MKVVTDSPGENRDHGYTKTAGGEVYYWYVEDDELTWRLLDHDSVPEDVRATTRFDLFREDE